MRNRVRSENARNIRSAEPPVTDCFFAFTIYVEAYTPACCKSNHFTLARGNGACDSFCQVSRDQILNFLAQLRIIPLSAIL